MSYTIIDSPVTFYSSVDEITAWIEYLETLDSNKQVQDAIAEAKELLDEVESQ